MQMYVYRAFDNIKSNANLKQYRKSQHAVVQLETWLTLKGCAHHIQHYAMQHHYIS